MAKTRKPSGSTATSNTGTNTSTASVASLGNLFIKQELGSQYIDIYLKPVDGADSYSIFAEVPEGSYGSVVINGKTVRQIVRDIRNVSPVTVAFGTSYLKAGGAYNLFVSAHYDDPNDNSLGHLIIGYSDFFEITTI